ncbi:hypothetical protein WCX72_07800 [Sulfurimonas sp. HSL1-6]|uniref:hypothetical protein n=1 Tax=Thiomicrolovo immobilis TaxID=3131935 RepID=UPI0031F93900
MTIDVNVKATNEDFLDDIDEIIEDTMVQIFFLQPEDEAALEKAKEEAEEYTALFYTAPLSLGEQSDAKCVGYRVKNADELRAAPKAGKPLFVDEADLDDALRALLIERGDQGVILNATQAHEELEQFFIAIGPSNVNAFDHEVLAGLSMDKIMLQSGFPEHGFDEIFPAVKTISDAMFRPEHSIIARATKHALSLAGLKK